MEESGKNKLFLLPHLDLLVDKQARSYASSIIDCAQRPTPARYLLAWVFHGTANDGRNGASLFLLFSVSPFAGVACRWRRFSANVTRQLCARHTILGDVRPGLQNALRSQFAVCDRRRDISYIDVQNVRSFTIASVFLTIF